MQHFYPLLLQEHFSNSVSEPFYEKWYVHLLTLNWIIPWYQSFAKKLLFFQRQLVWRHVRGPSGPPPGLMIPEEDSWDPSPSYSQLWFLPAKGHQTQSAKGRGSWVRSGENQEKLPSVLSQWSHRGHLHAPSNAFYMWEHVWNVTH